MIGAICFLSLFISIHAPPRGATYLTGQLRQSITISIHAPPRGATIPARFPYQHQDFNSRPSARGDDALVAGYAMVYISIHAPPRGATARLMPAGPAIIFQFTPLREGRLNRLTPIAHASISIHAPPRGATATPFLDSRKCVDFNSRPSARGDPAAHAAPTPADEFQFTPLREGRRGRDRHKGRPC